MVAKQLTDLLWQREQIQRIGKMIEENPRLQQSPKPFLWDARRWYAVFAVMAVRRQADKMDDVYSLHRVLREMVEHPECVNREMVVSLFRDGKYQYDTEFESVLIDAMWNDFATESGAFDAEAVRRDLAELENISRKLGRCGTKTIAHTTQQGVKSEPTVTFNELDACIDSMDRMTAKYERLLTGAALAEGTHKPTEQFDWYEEFTFAWRSGPGDERK